MDSTITAAERLDILACEVASPGPHHFARADVAIALREIDRLREALTSARAAVPLRLDRADLTELALILTEERYRLDKGDDKPVPQPRWGANVRISQAVNAALAAPACACRAETVHQAGCPAAAN